MGQEIVYCDGCRERLTGQDAFRVGLQTFCASCTPRAPAPRRPPSERGAARVRPLAPKAAAPLALWIALALGALALVVLVAVASSPGRGAPHAAP